MVVPRRSLRSRAQTPGYNVSKNHEKVEKNKIFHRKTYFFKNQSVTRSAQLTVEGSKILSGSKNIDLGEYNIVNNCLGTKVATFVGNCYNYEHGY